MVPTIGRIVHFKAAEDVVRPAIITEVHSDTCVNLQVFQPGQDNWRTSVTQGEGVGQWQWMPYQVGQAAKTEELEKQLEEMKGQANAPTEDHRTAEEYAKMMEDDGVAAIGEPTV